MVDFLDGNALLVVLAAAVAYTAYGVAYRLYLSPIAKFPGPKLAALTFWYQMYYDVYPNKGQYTLRLAAMHEKYGPIIRINPIQLHISTPELYESLYSTTVHVDKCGFTYGGVINLPGGIFNTLDHELHRNRRAAVSQYFSVANVRRLQPVLDDKMEIFLQRLREMAGTGKVSKLMPMTSAFSSDVIMVYCFGQDMNKLQHPDFDAEEFEQVHAFNKAYPIFRAIPWVFRLLGIVPESVFLWLGGPMATLVRLEQQSRELIRQATDEKEKDSNMGAHRTVFHEMLSSSLPLAEKSIERLVDEATGLVFAAGETIAWTLTVITYYLLANPSVLMRLKLELQAAEAEKNAAQTTTERLPYLSAVIKEGLRLSYGAPGILGRVLHKPLVLIDGDHEWTIPAGTSVGMSSAVMHHDERVFPDSHTFIPERWIENPRLDQFSIPFSKGPRSCVGMNLANQEMHLWLSSVFQRFGSKEARLNTDEGIFELVDTDIDEVQLGHEFFTPFPKGSKGVHIRVLL